MEFDLRVVQLEEDLVKIINESGLPPTVINLVIQKLAGNIEMSVNMQLAKYKDEKAKEVQPSDEGKDSKEENDNN